ncbi:MAG: hypothetical protein JO297_08190 [Nitrososphaeraceae archaeon]|nr:hypothetical protein [Nitrososphaeraceae archaeon]
MESKKAIKMVLIISTISAIVTMVSMEQKANAATNTTTNVNTNTINCQSKKGSTNTAVFGTLKYAGGKCTGQNGGTVAAGGITSNPLAVKNTISNTNTINCQSKKGSTNTAVFGTLKYAGGKCTGQNGGTVAAGGVKSNSGAVGMHHTQGPNSNSHFGGFIKR